MEVTEKNCRVADKIIEILVDEKCTVKEKELLIIYKVSGEALVSQTNAYLLDEFIEKKVNPIYEKYPYAQVRIEVSY